VQYVIAISIAIIFIYFVTPAIQVHALEDAASDTSPPDSQAHLLAIAVIIHSGLS